MRRKAAQSRKEKVQAYSSREVYGKTALFEAPVQESLGFS
jgi:hypothetical protein